MVWNYLSNLTEIASRGVRVKSYEVEEEVERDWFLAEGHVGTRGRLRTTKRATLTPLTQPPTEVFTAVESLNIKWISFILPI